MFAVTIDLAEVETTRHHAKGLSQAYTEIGKVLAEHSFQRVQGGLYVTENEDMANLFLAIQALKELTWFPKSVLDVHAFRINQWSNFTQVVKS